MGLPGPGRLARLAAGTALHVTATGVGLAAGTAVARRFPGRTPGSRQARPRADGAAAVAESAVYTATVLAKAGARAAGAVITGVDDATDGNLDRLTEAGKAMFEPPDARRSRRVWVSRGRAHLELATLRGRGRPVGAPGAAPPAGAPRRRRVGRGERRRRPRAGDLRRAPRPRGRRRRRSSPRSSRPAAARRSSRSTRTTRPTSSRWSPRWSPSPSTPSGSASPTPAGCCRCRG